MDGTRCDMSGFDEDFHVVHGGERSYWLSGWSGAVFGVGSCLFACGLEIDVLVVWTDVGAGCGELSRPKFEMS